ncbi:hypothetical protein O162_09095 [Pseudomonas putida SJ3]|nr:hypothetical protein O162_09095 [Pseudomonas putida SJ3]
MKGIVAICLLAVLSGCSTIKLNPTTSGTAQYRTPIDGVTAQLILSQEFQRTVITQKPSYGKAWGPREFEISVGRPLSQAIAADLKSRIPSTRVGDRSDGKPSSIVVIPQAIKLEFGVDDGRAMGVMAGFGVLGAGSDAVVGARVTVKAVVTEGSGLDTPVEVVGVGSLKLSYITIDEADVNKTIGMAIDDVAEKLGDSVGVSVSIVGN